MEASERESKRPNTCATVTTQIDVLTAVLNPKRIKEIKFEVVNIVNSVANLMETKPMKLQPHQDDARATEVRLHVDQVVRLMTPIPELSLRCGELGVVISAWFAPTVAYEVEFCPPNENSHTRVLVLGEHLQAEPAEG
jgi:glutaredoxin-related protein